MTSSTPRLFEVVLEAPSKRRLDTVRALHATLGLDLIAAKNVVDAVPRVVVSGVSGEQAERVAKRLREVGARVSVRELEDEQTSPRDQAARMRAHRRAVLEVRLCPDLQRAATVGRGETDRTDPILDGQLKLWSLVDGRVIARLDGTPLGFSSDGVFLFAARGDDLAVIDAATGVTMRTHPGVAKAARRAGTDRSGVVTLALDASERDHDIETGAVIDQRPVLLPEPIFSSVPESQWARIVFGRREELVETCQGMLLARRITRNLGASGAIEVLNSEWGEEPLLRLRDGSGDLSADGQWLLYGDQGGEVSLWDLRNVSVSRRFVDEQAFPDIAIGNDVARRFAERRKVVRLPEIALPEGAVEQLVSSAEELGRLRERISKMLPDPSALDPDRTQAISLSLDHVQLKPGWRLYAKATGWDGDAVGRVLAFPEKVSPDALRSWLRRSPLDDRNAGEPEGAAPPLHVLHVDGSPASYFEAVILANELGDYGSHGHLVGWGRYGIVDECGPLEEARLRRQTEEDVHEALSARGLALEPAQIQGLVGLELARRGHSQTIENCALAPGVVPADFVPMAWTERDGTAVVRFATYCGYGMVGFSQTTVRFPGGACEHAVEEERTLATGGLGARC